MTAIFQIFVDVIGIFVTFVKTYLIPATASEINILHVAIWTPVTVGLIVLTVGMLKGMWQSKRKA